jgi:hypothetical protein
MVPTPPATYPDRDPEAGRTLHIHFSEKERLGGASSKLASS